MKAMNGWMNEGMNKKMNGEQKSLKKGLDQRTKKLTILKRMDEWIDG